MEPIDIVVTWVDQSDINWQQQYNKYMEEDIKKGVQSASNRQAFGKERYRNWDNFQYWFRGVEQNCPWVNKIFLIVDNKNQLPKWLNINHPKLRIVYHNEFIPQELLPTFNSITMEMFYYRIPDLSNCFITCNDDFFFLNPTPRERFFTDDGQIVQSIIKLPYKLNNKSDSVWHCIVDNSNRFLKRYMKAGEECCFAQSHLPEPRLKSFETEFMSQHFKEIYDSIKISHFRHKNNYLSWLFIDMLKLKNKHTDVYKNSKYLQMDSNTKLSDYTNCEMVCFNDTPALDNFEKCKTAVLKLLQYKFPSPSSFEYNFNTNTDTTICKPIPKTIGIPSWLPDREPDRQLRIERLNRLFNQIADMFGENFPVIVIAQNWKNYTPPKRLKNIKIHSYSSGLGILKARKELRAKFLASPYDYLIMFDDDAILECKNGVQEYLHEMDKHPDGFCFVQYQAAQLNFCAISRDIYKKEPMVDIDPQKDEGYEDIIFANLLFYKYPDKEFYISGVKCTHFKNPNEKAPSTWARTGKHNFKRLEEMSQKIIDEFKKGNYNIADIKSRIKPAETIEMDERIATALEHGWISKSDIERLKAVWLN